MKNDVDSLMPQETVITEENKAQTQILEEAEE